MLLMMEGLKRKDGAVDWIELPSHERIIIFSSTVSHTERGKLGNFYQRFPSSKVLYLFVVTLLPVSLILSCRRRKGGKKRWQRRKNAKMQKPKRQHKPKNCTLPQSLWSWLGGMVDNTHIVYGLEGSALWKCTRGHCQCTGLGCIRREGARGVLVKVGVEKVVWTDLVWGEDGRSGVGGGGGTWQASNWGGRSRQFSYSLLLPALLNAELLVSYIKRVHCTLRNAHYKRVSWLK